MHMTACNFKEQKNIIKMLKVFLIHIYIYVSMYVCMYIYICIYKSK